jgi:hypothetical protein
VFPGSLLDYKPKIYIKERKEYILDPIRKKYVRFTPEEWVRQFAVHQFTTEFALSRGFIKIEKTLTSKKNSGRYDISIVTKANETILILECKSPYTTLNSRTLQQVEDYSYYATPLFIGITNGVAGHIWNCKNRGEVTITEVIKNLNL